MKQLPLHLEASLKAVNRKHHKKMANRIQVCRRLAFDPCEHNIYSEIVLQLLFQEMEAARRYDFPPLASSTLTHTKAFDVPVVKSTCCLDSHRSTHAVKA